MNRFVAAALALSALASACAGEKDSKPESAPPKGVASAPGASSAPLQQWMKANAATALNAGNTDKLVTVFKRTAELAPPDPEFGTWSQIANTGAQASEKHDLDGARAACKQCHDAHRTAYKAKFRDRDLASSAR